MSRRDQIRMSDDEVQRFLEGGRTAILCSVGRQGVPHPMPMWYALEDGAVVMTTFAKSQKVANLRRDPRVSLLLEDGESYAELRGAVLYGEIELDAETGRVLDVLTAVTRRMGAGAGADDEQLRAGLLPTARKRVALRLRPERIVSWNHAKLGGAY